MSASPRLESGPEVSRAKPPPLMGVAPRATVSQGSPLKTLPPSMPSPRQQPESPRNKSNPRPTGSRSVPLNPIQALKLRRAQQAQELDERQMQQLQEADAYRQSRPSTGSAPPSPRVAPPSPRVSLSDSRPSLDRSAPRETPSPRDPSPREPSSRERKASPRTSAANRPPPAPLADLAQSHDADDGVPEIPLTPLERRALRKASASPCSSMLSGDRSEQKSHSGPSTMENWRAPGTPGSETPPRPERTAATSSPATDRLRERMRNSQRQGGSERSEGRRPLSDRPRPDSNWQERIEERQRQKPSEEDYVGASERQSTSERSGKRTDVMRRVMERQAQRQQDVEQLEA